MKTFLFVMSFIYSSCGLAQGPPPAAVPEKENISLIDELIEVMDYELCFNFMRDQVVQAYAEEHDWSEEKTQDALNTISYLDMPNYKREGMYYNIHANKSSDELKKMITRFKSYSDKEKMHEHVEEYLGGLESNWLSEIQALCREKDKS
jgi:hypothetical protein